MLCIHAAGELRKYTGCEKAIADLTPEEVATLRLDPVRFASGGGESAQSSAGLPFRIPFLHEVRHAPAPESGGESRSAARKRSSLRFGLVSLQPLVVAWRW